MASSAEKCIVDPRKSLGDSSMKRKESLTTPLDDPQGKGKVVKKRERSSGPSPDVQVWKSDVVFPRLSKGALRRWYFRRAELDDILTLQHEWWPSLRENIYELATDALIEYISWDYVNDHGKKSLSTWFPLAKDYIDLCKEWERSYGSLCIYSAWIWHILLDYVFSPSSKRWFGENWNSFGRFHSKFKEHVDPIDNEFTLSLYAWRSESVQMLYTFNGTHVDPELVKQTLRDNLEPFFVAKGAKRDTVEGRLSTIVELAILIDRQMLVSKWDYKIEMSDPQTGRKSDFPFTTDTTVMEYDGLFFESDRPSDGARVDFVSVPSLRVLGKFTGGADTNPYVQFMRKKLVKYYHLSRLNLPMQVVTDQLSNNACEAREAEKKRAEMNQGECEGAVAKEM
ncbi:unnamed protein product [Clonostachys rosea]|uniref:Uncharacterized protein n=1 Tax=Bionectria ochroleuca TaxID=29856 RepID=A0ABY6UA41_BIOOC|nr:unnamed protein product [Clonostachys rosea]